MQTHEAIISQLGGPRIFAMAFKHATYSDTRVTLSIAKGLQGHKAKGSKITHVRVTLDPTDTYTVEFLYVVPRGSRVGDVLTIRSEKDVYADGLKPLVENTTRLRLSL